MIEVKNLVKKFGNYTAVDHLNFHIKKGQIYGFLGPNGAGKSTTMNMITGYIAATEGEVKINGHDIFEEPELAKKSIGYLPEIPPVYMDMTPAEYLAFSAELKGIGKDKRKAMVQDILEMTGILSMQNRLIKNLSKGYRQRVGLAQALIGYPEVLILDEPTVGLDPKQIIEMRELIRNLGKTHTVILSSHILSEISEVCDYVMIISNGRLVASDSLDNLVKYSESKNTIELTVKGSENQITEVMRNMTGIKGYHISASKLEADAFDVSIVRKDGMDVREKLFYDFARVNCPILMMKLEKLTLEDVFLEKTHSEQGNKPLNEQAQEEVR